MQIPAQQSQRDWSLSLQRIKKFKLNLRSLFENTYRFSNHADINYSILKKKTKKKENGRWKIIENLKFTSIKPNFIHANTFKIDDKLRKLRFVFATLFLFGEQTYIYLLNIIKE